MPAASAQSAADRAQQALADVLSEIDASVATVTERAETQIAKIRGNAREETKQLRARRREVERAQVALGGRPAKTKSPTQDSRIIAGKQAIESVRACLADAGQAFQADITKETGLNSGTVTHALRALAAEGVIEATGEKRGNSPGFRFLGAKAAPRKREPVAA